MARPRFVMEWAAEDTEEGLKERYRREERADVRMRLHGLWLLRTGRAVRETAAAVGVHRRTVDRWVDWYRTGGVTEVISHHQGGRGRPPRLTAEQEEQVRAEVATGRVRTAAEIGRWIESTVSVAYRPGGVTALLHRLQAAPTGPRPRHVKADPAAQEEWKKGGSLPP